MSVTVSHISQNLGRPEDLEVLQEGGLNTVICGAKDPPDGSMGKVAFAGPAIGDIHDFLARTTAALIIIDRIHAYKLIRPVVAPKVSALLWSENPRLDFCRILNGIFPEKISYGIDPSASVHPTARLGARIFVGPGCIVGAGVEAGDDCILHGRVVLYPGTRLGNGVILHAGAVLGADGFGYERRPDGSLEKFPHSGGVMVEDEVEIGANCTIDRGTIGDTHIKKGAKIDNLVQIAHNAIIGEHTLIMAGAVICGGAEIGARCWVAPNVVVRQKMRIGDGATLGMGTVINAPVGAGETMVGYQARPARAAKRIASFLEKVGSGC